jgi:hypothetical protein
MAASPLSAKSREASNWGLMDNLPVGVKEASCEPEPQADTAAATVIETSHVVALRMRMGFSLNRKFWAFEVYQILHWLGTKHALVSPRGERSDCCSSAWHSDLPVQQTDALPYWWRILMGSILPAL